MPLGTPPLGSGVTIEAATTTLSGGVYTPGTYSPVSDLNRVDENANSPVTNVAVFGRTSAYSVPGTDEETCTIAGLLSLGDTGQGILDTAKATKAVVAVQILYEGTTGFVLICRVGSRRVSATPEGLVEVSYDLLAVAPKTSVP